MDFLFCWQRVHVSGDVFAGIRWWIKKEATEARLLFRGRTFFIHELIKSLMKSIHNPRAMATERPMKYEPLPTGTCHFQGWFFCSHWCDHCVSFCALPAQTKSVSISRMHVKKKQMFLGSLIEEPRKNLQRLLTYRSPWSTLFLLTTFRFFMSKWIISDFSFLLWCPFLISFVTSTEGFGPELRKRQPRLFQGFLSSSSISFNLNVSFDAIFFAD